MAERNAHSMIWYNEKTEFKIRRHDYDQVSGVICGSRQPDTGTWLCRTRYHHSLEKLKETGAYEIYQPDIVLMMFLVMSSAGGFSMPMRKGYADKVFIITSGENMAIHAGANIAMAVQNFKNRGYASLGGIILNRRNVKREEAKVELADDFETTVVGKLTRSELVTDAEEQGKTLMGCYPDSEMAEEYRTLTENILKICRRMGYAKRIGGEINPEGAVTTIG